MSSNHSLTRLGFTLVELLIVIAIIGLLASVILPRFGTARDEAFDAKIKTEIDMVARRADIEESRALTYDVVCGTNGFSQATSVANIIAALEDFASTTVTCRSNTEFYAVSVPLDTAVHWCVDSVGERREIPSPLGAMQFSCP